MTGFEKMKSRILEEARILADSKVKEAVRQAEELLKEAEQEAKQAALCISENAQKSAENARERTASDIDLLRRRRLLVAKQEMIAEVFDLALRSIEKMEGDQYFALIVKLVEKYALPEEGVIYFAPEDRRRMPKEFATKVKKAAEAKGGRLVISEEERNVGSGFVLAYGGVEENCTWEAIFESKREELADQVQHLLFGSVRKGDGV